MSSRIRASRRTEDDGFTLVELLVVIIIIGILAAIAIPVFLNQRQKAVEASMKSDLRAVAEALEAGYVDTQSYYTVSTTGRQASIAATPAETVELSPNVTVDGVLVSSGGGYCLTATSPKTSKTWYFDSVTGGLNDTGCSS